MAALRLRRAPKQDAEAPIAAQEDIARLAYELYEQRGRVNGCDLDDWLRAEEILRQRNGRHRR